MEPAVILQNIMVLETRRILLVGICPQSLIILNISLVFYLWPDSSHPDSGGSQFFICAGDVPHLDGQYTVFGQVVDGIDVIDKIVNLPKDSNDNPLERVEMIVEMVDEEKIINRIGLALGGGGARGAAHIGVLKHYIRKI